MRPPHAAFSLLEMMVAVTIFTILVALLLPIAKSVKESGSSTVCASNLRQIGVAIQQFAADNDGLIVPNRTQLGSARHYWVGLLAPYLGAQSAEKGFSGSQDKTPYMCPTGKTNSTGQNSYTLPVSASVFYRTRYDINSHITAAISTDLAAPHVFRAGRMAQMKASKTYIFMDLFGGGGGGYWAVDSGRLNYPHSGRINVLFLDGHIEAKTPADMQYYASQPYHVFWRGYDWGFSGYRED